MPYKDYNNKMNDYMKRRWEERRALAVEFLGGKCSVCETEENLQFDHINPEEKTMTIAKASSRSEEFFWAEVRKCQLLCEPHHKIKTAQDYLDGKNKKSRPVC